MPQSEEHLAVLDLLGVRHGVVAVTKADRVDDELLEFVTLEVEGETSRHLSGGNPDYPRIPVPGRGMDDLREALELAVLEIEPMLVDLGRPRLWVDRSFTITGAGTVVTGTLLDGPLARATTWRSGRATCAAVYEVCRATRGTTIRSLLTIGWRSIWPD